jgi:molybdopterin synthase catalytic subunit
MSMIAIIDTPIDIAGALAAVAHPGAGGTALFVGTTRDNARGKTVLSLEYEAHRPMALAMMEKIAADAGARWGLLGVAVVHRCGRVDVGEASVVVAVATAHRAEAFAACRYIIDTLKSTVPIWKKESFADGSAWVDGTIPKAPPPAG